MSLADLLLGAILLAIAIVDFRTYRIPDWLSLPLLAAGLTWAAFAGTRPWHAYILGAALGYLCLAGFGELYFRLRGRDGLGLGDAKLFAAGGAWLGWQALPLVLAVAAIAGLIFALVAAPWHRFTQIAFGPWLAVGIWVVWLMR